MVLRLIHTSDWQIGKVFRFVDDGTTGLLQEARLAAVTRLAEQAVKHGAGHILVAGDVYDMEALSPRSLNQPLERMRKFEKVTWHLMPGNHDPHRPHGLWDQLLRRGVPDNVIVHVNSEPRIFETDGFAVLPAPLQYRRTLQDPTAYMDDADVPDGIIRIGLAHGTVTGFGSDDKDVPNYINPDRPQSAGLAYLALGDWHGQKKINNRIWYSGTHETDAFDVDGGGQALLVELENAAALPVVSPVDTGRYRWKTYREQINIREDIDSLATILRGSGDDLNRILVRLYVEGAVSLQDRQYFEEQIIEQVSAAFCYLRVDDTRLFPSPSEEDLDQIDRGGFVRTAADILKQKSDDTSDPEHEIAALALQRLYVEHMKLQTRSQ
ncbi:metallophosphoesterase family protein [Oceanibacterium hippocampi]|uniref:Putative metallophosphoesterase YhaO n=1 Tax=Oceanibacterium hippocampi TaxID=745714 RepID=A0A1Y5U453_9PROT|nr:metallophosphoesterase [Oceanibacterium hippocampi]SLN77868.1 putative metallophosphoesterase YhaO [Oceanibacterium hippocampi]